MSRPLSRGCMCLVLLHLIPYLVVGVDHLEKQKCSVGSSQALANLGLERVLIGNVCLGGEVGRAGAATRKAHCRCGLTSGHGVGEGARSWEGKLRGGRKRENTVGKAHTQHKNKHTHTSKLSTHIHTLHTHTHLMCVRVCLPLHFPFLFIVHPLPPLLRLCPLPR